jgi:hypothetical protein
MALKTVTPLRPQSTSNCRIDFDRMLELETTITQARCLTAVLTELCLPGGNQEAGEIALDQLGPAKLYSTLSVLEDLLKRVDEEFHALGAPAGSRSN